VLTDVQKCLQSGDLTSAACQKVLADVDLLASLKKKCQKDKYVANPVCQLLATVPDVPVDDLGELLDGVLGSVLGRSRATAGAAERQPSTRSLLGGVT
jgi:phospholipid/cholesterol/gamma-HCH transport system substrate-binding protein